jgi:hypothetical protein
LFVFFLFFFFRTIPLSSNCLKLFLAFSTILRNQLGQDFDIHNTRCFRDEDKQSIFGIIETAGDGRVGFNDAVRSLANAASANESDTKVPFRPPVQRRGWLRLVPCLPQV